MIRNRLTLFTHQLTTCPKLLYCPPILAIALVLSIVNVGEATSNNGKVEIKKNALNQVLIRITDPDGIANYFVFQGQGIGGALEDRDALKCPNQHVITLAGPGGAGGHPLNHMHTVHYADCQVPWTMERWELPEPTNEWQEGTRVEIPVPEQSSQRALLEKILLWGQIIAVLLGIQVILSLAISYRIFRSRRRENQGENAAGA